ncbi:MAG: hypothetical protein ACOYI4_03685 [Christensenellales bacterium]|jgi:hypothetical protein
MGDLIKTSTFDLPVKELPLGGGVTKILTASPAPLSSSTTPRDHLTVCFLGRGVRCGDSFIPPSISYEELFDMFEGAEKKRYSAKNTWFGYRLEQGNFLPLEDVFEKLYGEKVFSMTDAEKVMPDAKITVASGGRSIVLKLSQMCDDYRYFYPLLSSEQILAGMDPAQSRGESLQVGLLLTEALDGSKKVVFVIGQRNWNDINEPSFVEFCAGGAGISIENLPQSRTKHNVIFVGPLGGKLGENIRSYTGRGAENVVINAKAGELIRFNLDNDDFLNSSRMYYKFTLDNEPCGEPSPEDGFVYNTRIPLWFGSGADYPSGIVLPTDGIHKSLNIKMLAHSDSYDDSEIDSFTIRII